MMSQGAKISFIGLLNWYADLFEDFNWPAAFTQDEDPLDKNAFLDELLTHTAELEVLYPQPEMMRRFLGSWSKTRVPVWDHMWETTQYEYNPIENYNRIEIGTDIDTHSGTDYNANVLTRSGSDTESHSGTDTVTDTPDTSHYVAAYDSVASGDNDGLVKQTRDEGEIISETEYNSDRTTEYDSSDSTQGSLTHGHVLTKGHQLNVHGNIGTVTTQDMVIQEREIAIFNLYEFMIQDIKNRFCILVY